MRCERISNDNFHDPYPAFIIDRVIRGIVESGHPKAKRLAEDYNDGREALLTQNPNMTIGEATVEVLVDLLEQAYGIHYVASLADRISMEAADGLAGDDARAILQAANGIRQGDVPIVA